MKRSNLVWTMLALALVTLLAVACEQQVNPAPQNTAAPTDVVFPTGFAQTPSGPPTVPNTGPKATTAPSSATQVPVVPNPTVAPPVATAAAPNPTVVSPATTVVPAGGTPTSSTSPAGEVQYTVKPGDTLFRISLAYGLTWQTVAAYNGITNPNAIYVGQVISIPTGGGASPTPVPSAKTYVVQPGDNLFRISLAYGLSYLTVAQYNDIAWPYWVYPGQVIRIP